MDQVESTIQKFRETGCNMQDLSKVLTKYYKKDQVRFAAFTSLVEDLNKEKDKRIKK